MIKNRKGFTLVELLGVIVIIGILSTMALVGVTKMIDKSKHTHDEQQKNTIIMATESYLQAHRDLFPEKVGDIEEIKLKELYAKKYLKQDIKDTGNRSCINDDSKVIITKVSQSEYTYEPELICKSE